MCSPPVPRVMALKQHALSIMSPSNVAQQLPWSLQQGWPAPRNGPMRGTPSARAERSRLAVLTGQVLTTETEGYSCAAKFILPMRTSVL